ncbi:uncharacterized protein LOC133177716 [Saccostrea echinata]|uniref:uncharacterized protein LOC133177716 n=1 Tax=Saccostrea echinata TaxID=191078 RepID=UPI002A7EDF06|nr:uncharacterized protein LOC133177716 [Saccostrea echinata]
MPVRHCIAVGCTADSRTSTDLSFHQLPKVESELRKWLSLIRREGLRVDRTSDIRHYVVCSKHFVDTLPTPQNPYPTLFAYNNYKKSTPRKTKNSNLGRTSTSTISQDCPTTKKVRLVKCDPSTDKTQICYPYVVGELDIPFMDCLDINNNNKSQPEFECDIQCQNTQVLHDHPYICCSPKKKYSGEHDLLEKITLLEARCEKLEKENRKLKEENQALKSRKVDFRENLMGKILHDDNNVKHFLGLPSLSFLTFFLQFLAPFYDKVSFWKGAGRSGSKKWQEKIQTKPGKQRKLTMKEEFVMTMLKLRLGVDNTTLSVLFNVSIGYVSNLFSTWINFLAQILDPVIKWPDSEKIRKHMPLSFKLKYPNTTSIIDCTEVFIQKPKNCSAQASTWSNYKSHNTLKALVAIQPNGAFTFVSKFWSGNVSDRKITVDSKYIDLISPGDEVMADRGFQIRDLLTLKGAYLNMPPFTNERRNGRGRVLTSKQIIETRKIASLRIHVERAIRRLKSFKMLGGILPLKMKNLSSAMLRVAAAFCNFMPPLSKKFK